MDTQTLLLTLWLIGISAEAVTAALSAGRQKFDWFGVSAMAALTSLGGGTIRDILIDNYPLIWVENPQYLLIVIGVALVTTQLSVLARYFNRVFLYGDAIGLAAFSVLGTQIALELGHGVVIAGMAAVVTGVAGGIMRDIMSDRVPLVFTQELYASIAVLTAAVYIILSWAGVPENWVIIIALLTAFITRVATMDSKRGLPVFEYDDNGPDPRIQLSSQFFRRSMKAARRRARRFREDAARYSLLNRNEKKKGEGDDKDNEDGDEREQKWPPQDAD